MVICLMKIFGGAQCELSNVMLMLNSQTVQDIVKDFIALGIIAEIDNIILGSINGVEAEKEILDT